MNKTKEYVYVCPNCKKPVMFRDGETLHHECKGFRYSIGRCTPKRVEKLLSLSPGYYKKTLKFKWDTGGYFTSIGRFVFKNKLSFFYIHPKISYDSSTLRRYSYLLYITYYNSDKKEYYDTFLGEFAILSLAKEKALEIFKRCINRYKTDNE